MSSEYFSKFEPESYRIFLQNFFRISNILVTYFIKLQVILSFFGVFFNLCHIFILFHKKLRSQSVNVLIMGIAVSDIFYLFYYVDAGTRDFIESDLPGNCRPPISMFVSYWTWFLDILRQSFRLTSAYLGIFLALLRFVVIKYGTRAGIRNLVSPSFCWKIFVGTVLFGLSVTGLDNFLYILEKSYNWIPPKSCSMYPPNTTFPHYVKSLNSLYYYGFGDVIIPINIYMKLILKLLPPFLYLFLAIGLLVELRKASKIHKVFTKSSEMIHVTRLVIFMTVLYFLAESPMAVVLLCVHLFQNTHLFLIMNNVAIIFTTFLIIHSSIHCFICFFLSADYRFVFSNWIGGQCGNTVENSRIISIVT